MNKVLPTNPLTLKRINYSWNLLNERRSRHPSLSALAKSIPERHAHHLRLRPHLVDILNELSVRRNIRLRSDIIVSIIVVSAKVDDNDIRSWVSLEIPWLRVHSVDLLLA